MDESQREAGRMDHASYIVDRMRVLREARGISVAELARRSDMSSAQLGKVLRGERSLRAEEYLRLCYVLRAKNDLFMPEWTRKKLTDLKLEATGARLRR